MRTTRLWIPALAAGALGAIVAVLLFGREPDVYLSTAAVRVKASESTVPLSKSMRRLTVEMLERPSLTSVIQKVGLYRAERSEQPLEDIIETMRARDIVLTKALVRSSSFTGIRIPRWLATELMRWLLAAIAPRSRGLQVCRNHLSRTSKRRWPDTGFWPGSAPCW